MFPMRRRAVSPVAESARPMMRGLCRPPLKHEPPASADPPPDQPPPSSASRCSPTSCLPPPASGSSLLCHHARQRCSDSGSCRRSSCAANPTAASSSSGLRWQESGRAVSRSRQAGVPQTRCGAICSSESERLLADDGILRWRVAGGPGNGAGSRWLSDERDGRDVNPSGVAPCPDRVGHRLVMCLWKSMGYGGSHVNCVIHRIERFTPSSRF